jgi:hypothetical protein
MTKPDVRRAVQTLLDEEELRSNKVLSKIEINLVCSVCKSNNIMTIGKLLHFMKQDHSDMIFEFWCDTCANFPIHTAD